MLMKILMESYGKLLIPYPVIASDTHIYEQDVLFFILTEYDGVSPYTGEKLDNDTDNKHEIIVEMVNKFIKKHPCYAQYVNYYCCMGINSNTRKNYALFAGCVKNCDPILDGILGRPRMEDTRDNLLFSIMEKMNNHCLRFK